MGVHGLTSYLREKRRLLSRTVVLSSEAPVPVVVDGWSFLYEIYITSNLPWVYGGEYDDLSDLIKATLESWIKVGMVVHFVFDGPCPELKFPTVISRLVQSQIQSGQLFFRTSPASRSKGWFLSENRILPPLAYSTCIQALQALRSESKAVEIHFADEEGDPYAVELAGRLGGYVIGKDSDFVIFHSDGYKGYICIDEITWQVSPINDHQASNDADGEFQTVKKPKAKRKIASQVSQGLFPPTGDVLSLTVIVYTPESLAELLDIPVTLLPLFGALVGNDFSKGTEPGSQRVQSLFFARDLSIYDRIGRVADTIRNVMSPQKRKLQVGSVMDLIGRTVNALLSGLPPSRSLSSNETELIIEKVVNATLQYAILKQGDKIEDRPGLRSNKVCALHDAEACPILPIFSRNLMRQAEEASTADPSLLSARERYLHAYRRGFFSAKNMDILNTGSSWARLFLENPDMESVARSIGRPIRQWIYTILEDTVGLEVQPQEAETVDENPDDDDEEVVDVVESDGDEDYIDYLAPLKGELHRLRGSDDETTEPPVSITSHRRFPIGRPFVTEYHRSGTRIATQAVQVETISEALSSISLSEFAADNEPPLILRSEADRLTVLLRALKSDYPAVLSLSSSTIFPVLAIRWVIYTLHSRFVESESKAKEQERWTTREARCFLSSIAWKPDDNVGAQEFSGFPPIENRNVQLMAQFLMALDTIEQLVQVLMLTTRVRVDFRQFSGKTFHHYLTTPVPPKIELPSGVWEATETDLAHAFQEQIVKKKSKKERVLKSNKASSEPRSIGNMGAFALLSDLNLT